MSLRDDKRGHVKIENGMAVIYVPADETHGISRQAPYPARVVRLPDSICLVSAASRLPQNSFTASRAWVS